MNRLAEVLGVQEGQSFRFEGCDPIYQIRNGRRFHSVDGVNWQILDDILSLLDMVEHPEKIELVLLHTEQYTEQQLTAFRGRIAEGTPWVARFGNIEDGPRNEVNFFAEKPLYDGYVFEDRRSFMLESKSPLYDFVTFENSPIDLREIVEEVDGV